MGFSRQEHWSGLPFPSPGDLPDPGIELGLPLLQVDSLPSEPPGKPCRAMKACDLQCYGDTQDYVSVFSDQPFISSTFPALWPWAFKWQITSLPFLFDWPSLGFPGGSDSKESAQGLIPESGRLPKEGVATYSSTLAWRIPWTEEPGGLQSMGSQGVRHTNCCLTN